MPSYQLTADGLFYVQEGAEWQCLVSFWDYYKNMGAKPLHTYHQETDRSLPAILRKMCALYSVLAGETKNGEEELACMITVAMAFDQSLKGYRPLHILETGSRPGVLAVLLTAAVCAAHPGSRVYTLLEDVYDHELREAAGRLEEMRGALKVVAGGPQDGMLREGWFDMTVLSSRQLADRPAKEREGAVQSMLRSTRPGGYLVGLIQSDADLLEMILDLPGAAPARYAVSQDAHVLVKEVAASDYEPPLGAQEQIIGLHAKLKASIAGLKELSPKQLHAAIAVLKEMETAAIELDIAQADTKQHVNEIKEACLNALYTPNDAFRQACLHKLRVFVQRAPIRKIGGGY